MAGGAAGELGPPSDPCRAGTARGWVACCWLPCLGQKVERQGCRVGSESEASVVILKAWCLFFFKETIAFFAMLYRVRAEYIRSFTQLAGVFVVACFTCRM